MDRVPGRIDDLTVLDELVQTQGHGVLPKDNEDFALSSYSRCAASATLQTQE